MSLPAAAPARSVASPHFPAHTLETAPAAARPALAQIAQKFGFLPLPVARFATSPLLVRAFDELKALFEGATLSPVEREVVVMVVAAENGCDLCRAMHRGLLLRAGAPPAVAAALFERAPVPDARLQALAGFTEAALRERGQVPDAELDAFVQAGFTAEQALEVIVGIAAFTLSTFANRMTRSHALR
ncbi:carboxymuconolactone decarboxylase family protein [Sorangium cellulosum]|uniref:Alkylhydroperoxidase n=1 Tax=Sorangium cellulosum TaxID=56 RepID=A0A150QCX1_SORCE|nr:carboxymuconolactone decarboxylase family protein [Sorangium cellulosum]KYF65820.1 alkylhydroperoxidase [Sorangium cellulosum]